MKTISFSYNWNGAKLMCYFLTSFRLYNPDKYKLGETYNIELTAHKHTMPLGVGKIIFLHPIQLGDVTEFMARIDTGYSLAEFKTIIQRMYATEYAKHGDALPLHFIGLQMIEEARNPETFGWLLSDREKVFSKALTKVESGERPPAFRAGKVESPAQAPVASVPNVPEPAPIEHRESEQYHHHAASVEDTIANMSPAEVHTLSETITGPGAAKDELDKTDVK